VTQEKRPVTLITGASSGIGAALAHEFAANGHELVLIARREQALAALADAIAAKGTTRPTVLPADLARADATQAIAEALDRRGLEPDVVVNNAGFGLVGDADTLDRAEQLAMIDLDVRALTDLSLAFTDSLKRRKGGILNVASTAAFVPGPGMAVYYASKAYVLSFSEALHRELKPKGVRVTVLCPGPVPRGPRRRRFSAHSQALGRAGGARRLSRPEAGPPRGRSGLCQQHGDDADPLCAARTAARPHRAATERPPLARRGCAECNATSARLRGNERKKDLGSNAIRSGRCLAA
jgi:short-subunit dehydrogenase